MSRPVYSYSTEIDEEQIESLRSWLDSNSFEFTEKPHARFSAKREKLTITVYEKGPKILVQGKETVEFVQSVLEPEILNEVRMGREEIHSPDMFLPHIGVDESGKGDYFGPLTVAGVFVNAESARALLDAGVADSKRVTSDRRIRALAQAIRDCSDVVHYTLCVSPELYNRRYSELGTVNVLLARGHSVVIEKLLEMQPDCKRALSDQFANPEVLKGALGKRGQSIQLEQRTKAESDIAVAAASILARESFIDWLDEAEIRAGMPLPRGASKMVKDSARNLVLTSGPEDLKRFAKVHFQTTAHAIGEDDWLNYQHNP